MLKPIRETDVAVVGGGPAGLAAAIAARLAGLEVTVVERSLPPIDKPCGEGIMPDGVAILDTRSIFYRDTERAMGWDISEQGFRLVLSPDIPELIRTNLRNDVDSFLDDHGLRRSDIRYWMSHTGGPKILSAIQETLELPEGALDLSWEQMRAVGNISSASVLQVLRRTLDRAPEQEGGYGLMMALGPGFCSELLLMRWPERGRAC